MCAAGVGAAAFASIFVITHSPGPRSTNSRSTGAPALSGLTAAPEAGAKPARTSVSHQATGTLEAIDLRGGIVTVTHGPVASLKWPAMTMDFVLANPSLVDKIKPGSAIAIEFVERKPGEWVITKMDATAAAKPITPAVAPALADPHKGH